MRVWNLTLLGFLAVGLALPAAAGMRSETLDCFGALPLVTPPLSVDLADWAYEETSPSSLTPVQSFGFTFPGDEQREIQCAWLVPEDFRFLANAKLKFVGWADTGFSCGPFICPTQVDFRVDVRRFTPDDYLPVPGGGSDGAPREMNMPWVNTAAVTLQLDVDDASNSVVVDHLRLIEAPADNGSGLLFAGDLAYFRITRDRLPFPGYPGGFHVPRVQISYETVD